MIYFFYYMPLGLDLRAQRTPWACLGLVAVITLGFVLQQFGPSWWMRSEGVLLYVPAAPHPAALLLNAYLHAGVLHLLSNLAALWAFGPALEERLGAWRFLALFHLANAAANLVQGAFSLTLFSDGSAHAILGASGAISGLLGLAVIRLPFAHLRIAYWTFMPLQAFTRAGAVRLAVPVAVVLWFVLQIAILALQSHAGGARIAVGSHLGGLMFGVAIGLLAGLRTDAHAEGELHAGRGYASQSHWYAAQGNFLTYVELRPRDAHGHLELARTLRVTSRHTEADRYYRYACALLMDAGRWDEIRACHAEALRGNAAFVFDARLQLQLAQLYERILEPARAEQAFVAYAHHYPEQPQAALALFRAANLARRRGARSTAHDLLARIVSHHPHTSESELAVAEIDRLAVQGLHPARSLPRRKRAA